MNPMDFFRAVIGAPIPPVGKPAEGNPYATTPEPTWLKESRESLARQEGEKAAADETDEQKGFRALFGADPFLAGYAYPEEGRKPPLGPAPAFLPLKEFATHFASRYTRHMGADRARALAWRDNLEWRRRCEGMSRTIEDTDNALIQASNRADALELQAARSDQLTTNQANLGALLFDEQEKVAGLASTLADRDAALDQAQKQVEALDANAAALLAALEANHHPWKTALNTARLKLRAATARAEMLNAAIQYACCRDEDCGIYAHGWLRDWNEGDESADDELRAWMVSDDGKAVLGSAMVGRDGMPDVPAPVGRERPGPAPLQPAQGDPGDETDYPEPGAVPFHPAPVGIFRQTSLQRSHCPNRVTRNSDNVETCNDPFARTKRCKRCPLLTR